MSKRYVLITGGSGGIGRALTAELVHQGMYVYSIDKKRPVDKIKGVTYIIADITDAKRYKRAFSHITHKLDMVINNAGVMRRGRLFDSSEDDFNLLFDVNVRGSWLTLKYALPQLARKPMIVQVSSRHGLNPKLDPAIYSLTKQTDLNLVSLLQKTEPHVDVRCICPGPVDTDLLRVGRTQNFMKQILRRALPADQFAKLVVKFLFSRKKWLLFDEKKWVYYTK